LFFLFNLLHNPLANLLKKCNYLSMGDGDSEQGFDPGQTRHTTAVPQIELPSTSDHRGHSLNVSQQINIAHKLEQMNAEAKRQQEVENNANMVDKAEQKNSLPPLTKTPGQTYPTQTNKNSR
jgi:hypothetical protein